MIIVRNDDILVPSGERHWPIEQKLEFAEKKFRKYCRWLLEGLGTFKHVPTILVTEIQQFPPSLIEYIKNEAGEGRMFPEIHGFEHIDYGKLSQQTIEEHLEKCVEWMQANLNVTPTKFYTPWGTDGGYPPIANAASKFGLTAIGTQNTRTPAQAITIVKRSSSLEEAVLQLEKKDILTHWWESGLRVPRLMKVFKYGGWKEAAKAEPDCFK